MTEFEITELQITEFERTQARSPAAVQERSPRSSPFSGRDAHKTRKSGGNRAQRELSSRERRGFNGVRNSRIAQFGITEFEITGVNCTIITRLHSVENIVQIPHGMCALDIAVKCVGSSPFMGVPIPLLLFFLFFCISFCFVLFLVFSSHVFSSLFVL